MDIKDFMNHKVRKERRENKEQEIIKRAKQFNDERERKKNPSKSELLKLVPKFKQSEFGAGYGHFHPESILNLKSFRNFAGHYFRR